MDEIETQCCADVYPSHGVAAYLGESMMPSKSWSGTWSYRANPCCRASTPWKLRGPSNSPHPLVDASPFPSAAVKHAHQVISVDLILMALTTDR
jgi:hypothetical protein